MERFFQPVGWMKKNLTDSQHPHKRCRCRDLPLWAIVLWQQGFPPPCTPHQYTLFCTIAIGCRSWLNADFSAGPFDISRSNDRLLLNREQYTQIKIQLVQHEEYMYSIPSFRVWTLCQWLQGIAGRVPCKKKYLIVLYEQCCKEQSTETALTKLVLSGNKTFSFVLS